MFKLCRYLRNYKIEVILGPIFKLFEAVFDLVTPLVMAKMIDEGVERGDSAYVWKLGGVMVLLGACGLGFALFCQYAAARAAYGFGTELRRDLFQRVLSFSYAETDRFGTASLMTRLTGDVMAAQTGVNMAIRLASRVPFLIIGSAVLAWTIDPKQSLIFLAAAPVVALTLYCIMGRSIPLYRKVQKKLDGVTLLTRENLSGVRVIRAFSKQEEEQERFHAASEALTEASVRVGKISALLNPMTTLITNLAIAALLWFGGARVNVGDLTQGEMIALVNYMTQIALALVVVANLAVIFTKAAASAVRIHEVLETEPTVTEGTAERGTADHSPKLELCHVTFGYGGDEPALRDVSLKLYEGDTLGIIGGTGSGKSTLVNLICRFYDPDSGDIFLDGRPLGAYSFQALRKKIGLVPQHAKLFSGTIAENLRWANPEASLEQMQKAAEISQSAEFIAELEQGYETQVQQGGSNFSGGQRQRLTIARALTGNPELLILDDSSSALDYATDYRLRKALKEQLSNTAVVMISQRASAIRHADQILVLDDGEPAGLGTHADLLRTCEVYREICRSQMTSEELEQEILAAEGGDAS